MVDTATLRKVMAQVYGSHLPMQIRMELDILSQVGVPLALAVSLSGASPVPLLHTLPTHPPPTRRPRRSSGSSPPTSRPCNKPRWHCVLQSLSPAKGARRSPRPRPHRRRQEGQGLNTSPRCARSRAYISDLKKKIHQMTFFEQDYHLTDILYGLLINVSALGAPGHQDLMTASAFRATHHHNLIHASALGAPERQMLIHA